MQDNGHVTDKLLRHFGDEKETGAKMRPAVLSGIVSGDVPLSYWQFFPIPEVFAKADFFKVTKEEDVVKTSKYFTFEL